MGSQYSTFFAILTFIGGALMVYYLVKVEDSPEISPYGIECPVQGIITVREGGRLGNFIWEYASAVAIGEILNLTPYMPRSILKCLQGVFQNLSVPSYEDTILSDHCRLEHGGIKSHCKTPRAELNAKHVSPWSYLCNTLTIGNALDIKTALKSTGDLKKMYNSGLLSDVLVLPKWICHSEGVSKLGVTKFQDLFKFRREVLDLVEKTIDGLLASIKDIEKEVSFVGVHVRRTDYNGYLKGKYGANTSTVDSSFYKRAMARMRELKPNNTVLFLIVSDDHQWCMKELVNETEKVFWGGMEGSPFHSWLGKMTENTRRSHDLALLASLNDTIIAYGTFGVTGALLSGGHTIVYNLKVDPKYQTPLSVLSAKYFNDWELMT